MVSSLCMYAVCTLINSGYIFNSILAWFKIYFPLSLVMVMYDNEFETKKNKIQAKDKIEPEHIQILLVTKLDSLHIILTSNKLLSSTLLQISSQKRPQWFDCHKQPPRV